MARRQLRREEYTVGWVSALPLELAAAQEMLDEEHENFHYDIDDTNIYTLGRIGHHNVVMACLPDGQTGATSAAVVAIQMKSAFKSIRFGLMVGIGSGVPSEDADIRLGDVVVSRPHKIHGGVVQYDFGKATPSGFERTGFLNTPPTILLNALAKLRVNHVRRESRLPEYISKFDRLPAFARGDAGPDVLFEGDYNHEGGATCGKYSKEKVVARQPRREEIAIHYGTIASGNEVMRDAAERDRVSAELGGVLCFETEAAGLMNNFPCLVIRGVCDYADSHKNKTWQAYAAGTAAACGKEVLSVIPQAEVAKARTVDETMTASSEHAVRPSYYLPFPKNRRFVGRGAELEELTQKLLVTKDCQRLALVGLGGVGKTQVALEFAHTVKATQPEVSIFWVAALSAESFEQACTEIARKLHITRAAGDTEDVKELVRQYLSTEAAGRWLLIVDNADDMDIQYNSGSGGSNGIAKYLPESEDGLIMFTTRSQEVAVALADSDVIELEVMSRREAVNFLEKSLIRKNLLYIEAITSELLDELTYLPLAIAQAAAYLNTNKTISIAEYLGLLRNTEQDTISLMSREFRDGIRYRGSQNAVATTWLVSFDQILQSDAIAADLLSFMSCIEPKAIPRSILPAVQPEERMVHAIGTLSGYAFVVRRGDEEIYDLHRLVHLATRVWVGKNGLAAGMVAKATQHVAQAFPSHEYVNRELWSQYLPHGLKLLESKQGERSAERYELCAKVGRCLEADGRVREAVRWLEEPLRWTNDNLGEEHPDRLASQHALAGAYEADGHIGKAVELLEHVVAVREKLLKEEHLDRLASQHELAGAYRADGQVGKAVELLEHVVAVEEKVLKEEHPSRLASQHALAGAYEADGQVGKAVKLLEHVVAVKEKMLKEEHPSRLASQHELAGAYEADGQVGKAVELLERVVAVEEKVLKEEHLDRLASQHALAGAYGADGQVGKAVELLEHVVAVKEKVLKEEHLDRLASQHALAGAYRADRQVGKAVKLLEHVVAVEEKVLKEEHPSRLASQHELARAYEADGQVGKAVKLLERVVAVEEKVLKEEHPDRLASQHALAGAYRANGQAGKAVELLEHVVAVREKVLKEEHLDRLGSQHELAGAYRANGQMGKAVKLLEHVVAVEEKVLKEEHPSRLASEHELAGAYRANRQVGKAVELLEHVVAVEEKVLKEEHPSRLASQHELAGAYEADGQVGKAVELLEHVVAVEEKVLKEEHLDRLASQHALAGAYRACGQVGKAVELLEHVVAVREMVLKEHPS